MTEPTTRTGYSLPGENFAERAENGLQAKNQWKEVIPG